MLLSGRLSILTTSTLVLLVGAWGVSRRGFGQNAAGEKPAADLIRAAPFDRVTLIDGSVLTVEPISPRPLPPYDPSKDKDRARERTAHPYPRGNIFLPGQEPKQAAAHAQEKGGDQVSEVNLHLLQGEVRDFKVERSKIKHVEYFEDILLDEGDRWAQAHDYNRAFECFLRVQARHPGWPGLDEHVNRLLFAEGREALHEGDGERGLRLLRELESRQPDFPGLDSALAEAYVRRIVQAFDLGLFARGRALLHEAERLAPDHVAVRAARDRFLARARELVQQANRESGPERLDDLTEALRVWPTLEGVGAQYAEAFAAEPTLDVAVTDVSDAIGPWLRTPADARVTRLMYLPILASDAEDALQGKRPDQLAEALETSDLGRTLALRFRQGIAWSDGSRPVSAIDVAGSLVDRARPASPLYNARWADLLERVEVGDESRLEIRLTRGALRPATWLLDPVGPSHTGPDGRRTTPDGDQRLVVDGPFRWVASDTDQAWFRSWGRPDTKGNLTVRRVHEVRFPHAKATLEALLSGEVSLVEHVPPDRVAGLVSNPEIQVGRFARPSLHRIALDGRNPVLRNRTLRRGLSYAIDRRMLLEEVLLKHPADDVNRVSDGPLAKGSYADAPDVKPLEYDPLLARMLVAAALKELGSSGIKLTLEYPALPEPQAVVPQLVAMFGLAGVEVVPVECPESELEAALRAGRRFDLAYRAARCDEPAFEVGGLICPGYDAPPDAEPLASVASPRILQLLLRLERAPEWPSARGLVTQIDRESRDELPVLPLWQLEDHYAWRTRLHGPAEVADHLYQGIDTWEIEPWYAKDPW